jgi:hypothetical protein
MMVQINKQLVELAAGYRAGGWLAEAVFNQPLKLRGTKSTKEISVTSTYCMMLHSSFRDHNLKQCALLSKRTEQNVLGRVACR